MIQFETSPFQQAHRNFVYAAHAKKNISARRQVDLMQEDSPLGSWNHEVFSEVGCTLFKMET